MGLLSSFNFSAPSAYDVIGDAMGQWKPKWVLSFSMIWSNTKPNRRWDTRTSINTLSLWNT